MVSGISSGLNDEQTASTSFYFIQRPRSDSNAERRLRRLLVVERDTGWDKDSWKYLPLGETPSETPENAAVFEHTNFLRLRSGKNQKNKLRSFMTFENSRASLAIFPKKGCL